MKLWIAVICIALLFAPKAFADEEPTADSSEPDETISKPGTDDERTTERRDIEAHLSHHHQLPDRQTLEGVSDEARSIVFEIARDDDAFLLHRQRAMKVLVEWADKEVYNYLVGLLEDEETEDGLRHHLLPVVANGFGKAALEDLEPHLVEASDPQVRISAAAAIANISDDRADELLEQALEDEEHPLVQGRIKDHLEEH